jgi:hypothetical protein
MANQQFRVRRHSQKGLQVVGSFDTIGKASTLASKRMRETGNVFRIERRSVNRGWEIAMELVPLTTTAIEAAIARGNLPKVAGAEGRKGQVLSYVRPTREVRVAWLDVEEPGIGELVSVEQLTVR